MMGQGGGWIRPLPNKGAGVGMDQLGVVPANELVQFQVDP